MTDSRPSARPLAGAIFSLVLALAWLAVPVWVGLTRAGALLAGHPAYPVLLVSAAAVGVLLLVRGVRALRRPAPVRPGPAWRTVLGRSGAVLATLLVVGTLGYLIPLPATRTAVDAMAGTEGVTVTDATTTITLTPTSAPPTTGFIFQPGAKVDPRAYVPLLTKVSEQGSLVVIVKQPLNIGFTATGAPEGIIEDHPEITSWSVGGHSLGGVAASSFAQRPDAVDGLVFWASYPLGSLAGREDLTVTSVSGTRDGLSTPMDIDASRADLPSTATFVAVEGAVHAFFGDYGEQSGDGTPTVSREVAQGEIVAATVDALARTAP
ncbi:MAG: alpha/beta hydrolase [Ornithinibacter sp.]